MKNLVRSKRNRVIFGVCGGLAEYFRTDPILFRIICVIITVFGFGTGLAIYLIAALMIPEEKRFSQDDGHWGTGSESYTRPYSATEADGMGRGAEAEERSEFERDFYKDAEDWSKPAKYNTRKPKLVVGAVILSLGILILGKQFAPSLFIPKIILPFLFIVFGAIIIFKSRREDSADL